MTFGILVYVPRLDLAHPIASAYAHIIGGGIELLEGYLGSHIAPAVFADDSTDGVLGLYGGDTWDAELGGLKRRCLTENVANYTADGSQIWLYRFRTPLTGEQKARGLAYLRSVEGLPYDCLDFARRAILDVAGWLGILSPLVPVLGPILGIVKQIASVDISKWLGIQAVVCYRLGANFMSALGFEGIDGATWGPRELDRMLAAGIFTEPVLVTDAVTEAPE